MAELIVELSPKEIAEGHQRRRRFRRVSFDLTWDEYADLCGVLPEEYARPEEYLRAIAPKASLNNCDKIPTMLNKGLTNEMR